MCAPCLQKLPEKHPIILSATILPFPMIDPHIVVLAYGWRRANRSSCSQCRGHGSSLSTRLPPPLGLFQRINGFEMCPVPRLCVHRHVYSRKLLSSRKYQHCLCFSADRNGSSAWWTVGNTHKPTRKGGTCFMMLW